MVTLIVHRYHQEYRWEHDSIEEAVDDALRQLEFEVAYPVAIEVNGERIWEQKGPSGVGDSLERLRRRERRKTRK